MIPEALQWVDRFVGTTARPSDPVELRLRKSIFALLVCGCAVFTLGWAALLAAAGRVDVAVFPGALGLLSLVTIALAVWTRGHLALQPFHMSLVLVGPAAMHAYLGGFAASSGIILLSVLAPLAALTCSGERLAIPFLVAFLALVIGAALADSTLAARARPLPPGLATACFALAIGGMACFAFFSLAYFVREREKEQAKSELLLRNVLPAAIAERLKASPGAIADGFGDVTVLFADIVNFTKLSARISPAELVSLLDEIFSVFDALAERHGLEKIKTIGDAYMVAGGIPTPRSDHVEAVAAMAVAMRDALPTLPRAREHDLRVRIGIHTGPVVAGVIGQRKFAYDLWGDTVNTASRMESHGQPGAIHVSAATAERLRSGFELEDRGDIDVKGKGPMRTFFLGARRG